MAQPEFIQPDFMQGSTEAEIHERMMANLPDDIDERLSKNQSSSITTWQEP